MKLYFSIDLESWAYPDVAEFKDLDSTTRKRLDNGFILESIDEILSLLDMYSQKLTFFVVAEMFDWYPDAMMEIKKAGHEVAYHTHRHTRIASADIMRKEISDSWEFLRRFKPVGFRAPGIYLPSEALGPLVEAGFHYSSSVYGSYLDTFEYGQRNILELPVSSLPYVPTGARILGYPRPLKASMRGKEIPFGSGYFLAALPLVSIEKMMERYSKAGQPVFMFAHNWQIVKPKNASFPGFWYKLVHPSYLPYTACVRKKVEYLLRTYSVGRMDELV